MARQYAIRGLPTLGADVKTFVDGEYIAPGELLPEGTTEFDLLVFMTGPNDELVSFSLNGIGINASIWKIVAAASEVYDKTVAEGSFGYMGGGANILL
jgi:hypothetical protein